MAILQSNVAFSESNVTFLISYVRKMGLWRLQKAAIAADLLTKKEDL